MKSFEHISEDIEQRRQTLRQRSADAVQSYKQKSAVSGNAIAQRRAEISKKAKQALADMISRKKDQEQQRAAAKAAQQEKQKMKDDIKKELEAERAEKKEDNEERRQSKEKKRMRRERAQQVLDTTG